MKAAQEAAKAAKAPQEGRNNNFQYSRKPLRTTGAFLCSCNL
jgi:hypothetical protein